MTQTEKSSRKVISGVAWSNPLTHDYRVDQAAHVHVFADDTELVQGVDYTVTNIGLDAGYAVTITNAGAWAPTEWVLDARPEIDQASNLSVGGQFGTAFEAAIDKLTRRVQRVYNVAGRALKMPISTPVGTEYEVPAPEADTLLGWNAAGTALENKAPVDVSVPSLPTFWGVVLATTSAIAAWAALLVLGSVSTRAALKALVPTAGQVVYLAEGGRAGHFVAVAGAIPFTDAAEGVFVLSNTPGFYWERQTTRLSPAHFGASLDITVDSATAIQACFDFVRSTYSFVAGRYLYSIHDDRAFMTTVSINATNIQQPMFEIGTLSLIGKCTGKIVLDMAGFNEGTINDLRIYGDKTNQPAVGVLFSRAKPGGVMNAAPNLTIRGGHVKGYYSKAAYVQFACEVSDVAMTIENQSRNVSAVGYLNAGHWGEIDDILGGLTSDYTTLPTAADGNQSNILHRVAIANVTRGRDVFLTITGITKANPAVVSVDPTALAASGLANGNTIFLSDIVGMTELNPGATNISGVYTVAGINVGAGTFQLSGINSTGYGTFTSGHVSNQTGVAVVINGAASVTWDNFYALSYGSPAVVIDTKNGLVARDLSLGFQTEPAAQYPIRIDTPSAGSATLVGLQIDLLNQFQIFSDCVIQTGAGAGNVILNDLKLAVRMSSNTPPNKIFGTPSKVTLNNFDIRIPALALANDFSNAGGWNGASQPSGVLKATDTGVLRWYGDTSEFRNNTGRSLQAVSGATGAGEGPTISTLRDKGAGVANDALGVYDFLGKNSANAATRYGYLRGRILVETATAETGRVEMVTINSGADAIAGYWQQDLINAAAKFTVAGTQVVGPRATGWTAGTGTANKGAFAAYAGATMSAAYVQAEAQATNDAAKNASQRIKAIEDALRTHGLIN